MTIRVVQSVARIYRYYKQHQYASGGDGASFRNIGQIEAFDRLATTDHQPCPACKQLASEEGQLSRSEALTQACTEWARSVDEATFPLEPQ